MRGVEHPELDAADRLDGEPLTVWLHRYREARDAGLGEHEAAALAESGTDLGDLRRLVHAGCPPDLLAWILL